MRGAPILQSGDRSVWPGVAALIDRADDITNLKRHGIHLLAVRRWRELGAEVPRDLVEEERRASLLHVIGRAVLRHVRDSCDGPVMLLKGLEVAAHYPDPELRPFLDVDVLVPDAERTQRQLLAAGFREIFEPEAFVDMQHLRPLAWPTLPILVEVHSTPKWPRGMTPPPNAELFDAASHSATGIDGVLALPPALHALAVAAHSWAHVPLGRIRDLVDVAALWDAVPTSDVDELALAWRMGRVWRSTAAALDALFYGGEAPSSLRLWARHLPAVRERTFLEHYLRGLMSPFWTFPPHTATARMARALVMKSRLRAVQATA